MTNKADKRKDNPKIDAGAGARPDQGQPSLNERQEKDISKTSVEDAEIISETSDETLNNGSVGKAAKDSNASGDLMTEETSKQAGDNLQAGKIPKADVNQNAKPASRMGLFSLGLVGIIAGAIGFFAAYSALVFSVFSIGVSPEEIRVSLSKVITRNTQEVGLVTQTVQRQETAIEDASQKIEALNMRASSNSEALKAQMSFGSQVQEIKEKLTKIELHVDDMAKRMAALESQPVSKIISENVIDAYNDEFTALQSSMQAQRAQVDKLIAAATAKESQALKISRTTDARLLLGGVQAAIDKGLPFLEELNDFATLTGQTVPQKLSMFAKTGATTVAELGAQFPFFARNALTAHRASSSANDLSVGLVDFLKSQFQARSVAPKDGNDVDAVLSRAEAAVRQGNLAKALEELSSLTFPAKDEMAKWSNQAMARLAAIDAVKLLLAAIQE
jgi:hypothetical protein